MIKAIDIVRQTKSDPLYGITCDGEGADNLQQTTTARGPGNWVCVIIPTAHELLLSYYVRDLSILPNHDIGSRIEDFGLVLFETQAFNNPVNTSNLGDTAVALEADVIGRIINATNPESIAAMDLHFLSEDNEEREMGTCTKERMLDKYEWLARASHTANLINNP